MRWLQLNYINVVEVVDHKVGEEVGEGRPSHTHGQSMQSGVHTRTLGYLLSAGQI